MDLVTAMIRASKAYTEPIAQAYASGNRVYTVRLERPGALGTFDRETETWTNPPDLVVYTGPARIFPATGGVDLEIGDERTPFNAATITLDPFDETNANDPSLAPQVDDVVHVLEDDQSRSTHIADRSFEVTSVEVGGHYQVGWTLQTLGAGPSRHGD